MELQLFISTYQLVASEAKLLTATGSYSYKFAMLKGYPLSLSWGGTPHVVGKCP